MKYLIFDCEMTGLNPSIHSLLTVSFFVAEEDGHVVDELNLQLLPDDFERGRGTYHVCADAMQVNKIDLVMHDMVALDKKTATATLKAFLKKHADVTEAPVIDLNKPLPKVETVIEHLIPIGHVVAGDIAFIKAYFTDLNWEKYVSYRYLDTASIARFLMDCGLFSCGGSLGSLAEYFGCEFQAHDAREDARATLEVFLGLRKMVLALRGIA